MKYKNNEIIIRNALESEFQRSTSSSYHGRSCTRCDGARIDFWARDKKKRKIGARFRATHNWTQKWTRTINSRDTKSQVRHQFLEYRVPLSSTPPSFQHISSTKKGHSFSAPEIRQFHTKNPWDPHQKPLSSTQKNPPVPHPDPPVPHQDPSGPHRKPLSSIHPSVQHTPQFSTENPSTEKNSSICVELRNFRCGTEVCGTGGFWCGTDGVLVLNWGILGAEKVWSLCWTDVLNLGGLCGTAEYS